MKQQVAPHWAATDPPDRARMMVTGWGSEDPNGSEVPKMVEKCRAKKKKKQ